jgi:serine protease inhibitor
MTRTFARRTFLLGLLAAACVPAVVSDESAPKPEPSDKQPAQPPVAAPSADDLRVLAAANNAFAFDLYRALPKKDVNMFMSPASIALAVSMTWTGAEGETAAEMQRVLHYDTGAADIGPRWARVAAYLQDPTRPLTLRIANRLFGEQTHRFEPAFTNAMANGYGAPLERLDFIRAADASRRTINAWVEEKTEHRIKDLLPDGMVEPATRLVLVNAIYFLGKWQNRFDKSATSPAPFHLSATDTKEVPMMRRTDHYGYAEDDAVRAVELPYEGGSLAMLVVVPKAVDGLAAVENSLDAQKLAALVAKLTPEEMRLAMPRFELSGDGISLKPALEALGMERVFDAERAELGPMGSTAAEPLYVSDAVHKAFVKVDEEGTEAAAATAMQVKAGSAVLPMELAVDRPFLCFVRDVKSGLVLFMGRIGSP